MKFVSRSEWGARYGRGNTAITPGRGGVTVHYEGGGKLTGHPHSACDDRVRNIESYHVDHNGWAGIAYTALVCEHGYVFEGRGLGHRTAANGTNAGNQNWYAVCALIGDDDIPGHDLKAGLLDAIGWCRSSGGAADRVNGHRDHLSTSCPGDRLYAWVQAGLPTEIEEDEMPEYVSVGMDAEQDLPPGEWVTVDWGREYSDADHNHWNKGGPSLIIGPARYALTCNVRVEGLPVGTELQARVIERAEDGSDVANGPIAEYEASKGATFVHYALPADTIGADRRVRFQVVQYGTSAGRITSGTAKGFAWRT